MADNEDFVRVSELKNTQEYQDLRKVIQDVEEIKSDVTKIKEKVSQIDDTQNESVCFFLKFFAVSDCI